MVFGIGNPGPEYDGTRHNLGFLVADALCAAAKGAFGRIPGLAAAAARVRVEGEPLLLVKPLTYVNRCGPVLAALRDGEGVPLERCLVVVDDFHLPLGAVRLRLSGSDGGHNGLRSLIDALGTEGFPRLRIGIGEPPGRAEEHVLSPFPPAEREAVRAAVDRAADGVRLWIRLGGERAMGEVNRRDLDPPADPA
ncbi:MAG TPA: aminoacyl-tRNA hydrolase [Planctomycetota bacterium]|nr:aminoacyl-tRNA hydrolase [Planctomycetota bacterium]